jgi:hypothetical protein
VRFERKNVKVGRFSCDLIYDEDGQTRVEWSPDIPQRGEISQDDLADYIRARRVLWDEVEAKTGKRLVAADEVAATIRKRSAN